MRNGRPILETALILCCLSVVSPTYAQDPHLNERHLAILRLKGEESYERALAQAKRLATEHPDFDKVYGIIFDLYVLLDDIDEARAFFEELFQRDPQNPYALYVLARIDFHVGDLDRAIERLKQTITLDPGFAEAYGPEGGLPDVYQAKKDLDAAIAYFEALTITDAGNANAFSGLGWSYARSFQFAPAIEAFSKALEFDADLTQAFHGLVQTYFRTGRLQKSLEYCQQLSQAAERNGDVETLAYARMMQGTIFWFRGDYRTALHYLNGSRKLAQEIGDKRREASTVGNIAAVYATAGNYEKALEYFETSVANARDGGETTAEINALSNIGSVHKEIGNNERALSYYEEALVIARKAGLKRQECETLANMAEAFQRRGDHGEAHVYFSNALRIAQEIENKTFEAFALGSLGSLSRDRGDYADALGYFNKALALGEETDGVQLLWEAQAGLGSTYERQGNVEKAIAHYTEAIALYDSVREGLAIESLGSSFLEDKYQAYPSIVQLLASQGKLEDAFTYTEKFKAKGFLDILARAPTLFESHLPESLLLELDGVRSELQETHAELSRARSGSTPDSEAIVALEQRVTDLELRKASLVEQAREEHGEFVELAVSEPLDAESLQSRVLEPGQALIEYLMGDEKLSIFVVTRDELRYREVPVGRDELRRRLAELSPLFEANGSTNEGSRGPSFNARLADFSLPPARALYELLLEPIEAWLPEGGELIVVPDDLLFYVPFEALVVDSGSAEHRYDFSAATFVVERYVVSYSPAASLLDPRLRRPRQFARGLLAFGNPAFDTAVEDQPPLPSSEAEVEAIRDAFGGHDNGVYVGREATEAVFKQEAEHYGVLHFATHFLSDDRQPLYSRILLAPTDGAKDDGSLQTYEIFDAKLNADLAVLSACNTGLGRLRKGEGLIGISRAFLYAGVPSLVVSLWSVDDEATAKIMARFYEGLRSGASKKQALRQAKLDYLEVSQGDKKDPFYWAPFVLNGDWQPLTLPATSRSRRPWMPVLLAGFGLVVFLFIKKKHRAPST